MPAVSPRIAPGAALLLRPWADDGSGDGRYARNVQVTGSVAGPRGPRASDWGLTALLLVPSLSQVLLDPIAPRPAGVLVAFGSVLPVAWRRTYPAWAAFAGTAFWLVPTDGYLILGFVVASVLFYSVGAHEPSNVVAGVVTTWGVTVGLYSILSSGQLPYTAFVLLVVVVAPVVVGRIVREWERRATELAELAARLQGERRQAEELAVITERNRIARELHDVIAHDVTVIALQADAASAALAHDPARAVQPVEAIRRTAEGTMHEMRRVLGGLRALDSDLEGTAPAPGPDDIPALVAQSRSLGQPVAVTVRGQPPTEHATIGLAVFRIVQESLTNARRHAPGSVVAVDLGWGQDAVDVKVEQPLTDPAPAGTNGLGLVGMHERARLLGGRFSAGPDGSGVFVVTASLPYENHAAET